MSPDATSGATTPGIVLRPGPDGTVSTSRIGRQVLVDAAAVHDAQLAARIQALGDWRRDYVQAFRDLLTCAAADGRGAASMSQAGA